eukprot:jgi/Pico_ML_1/53515/g4050.t1
MDGHREGFLERVEAFLKRHGEQEAFPEAPEGTETWQLMVLWDDLCHDLGARKISVEDVSNWHGMEFRMLHLAAHGSTWYGRFGYKQDLRDLVRLHIGDTGLLDHVLKTVGECTVGKYKAWQVKEVDGLRHVANRTRVSTVLRDGATVMLRGTGVAVASTWRFETGLDHWVVRCSCGTTDDDGERMLECERCGTWLHTRCLGITDAQAIPACFVCPDCGPSDRSA